MKIVTNKKGITLIALVITIIVLLILAGVSIATITGENGLFQKARIAKDASENATNEENSRISQYENEINNYQSISRNQVTISKEEYEQLKKKGTWELLASSTSTTAQECTVKDVSQYSSIVLIGYSKGNSILATSIIPYESFKNLQGSFYANYYSDAMSMAVSTYINDTKLSLSCINCAKAELYGIY